MKSTASSIRILTPDDAAIYRAVRLQALWEQPPAFGAQPMDEPALEVMATRLRADRDECFFGAFEAGELVGTLRLSRYAAENEKHRAYLAGLFVQPKHRRRGHGRALVTAAVERAKADNGLRRLNLTVGTAQKAARRLYESFGFQAYGTELEAFSNAGVYYDEHLMSLDLTGGRESFTAIADAWWASQLGCKPSALFVDALTIVPDPDAGETIFTLSREGGVMARVAPGRHSGLLRLLAAGSPEKLSAALSALPAEVTGPEFIGYTKSIPRPRHRARALDVYDAGGVFTLKRACTDTEWDRGGCDDETRIRSGVFTDGMLVSLASFETAGETIARLSVITHPEFRSRGYGRSALAHVARRALQEGLLPEFRASLAEDSAMKIAETLGFVHYATAVSALPGAG